MTTIHMPLHSGSRRLAKTGPLGEPRWLPYAYILPGLVMYVFFAILPFIHTGILAFTNWDGVTAPSWVGLDNFRALFADTDLLVDFTHSLVLVIFFSLAPICVGLLLTAFLTRAPIRGMASFRTLLFLPQVIPMVAVAIAWRWMYDPVGPVNSLLQLVGLGSVERAWLGDFTWALPALGLVGTWVVFGFCMVLFIAGVQKIPRELFDAARVDGAGVWQEFFAVILPGLRNEVSVALTVTTIAGLRSFDLVYVGTRGGPGHATRVPVLELYARAFQQDRVGSAAAIGLALAVVIFVVSWAILRVSEGGDH